MSKIALTPGPNEIVATASEFAKNFGYYRDRAMAGKVVKVTNHSRLVGGFLSPEEIDHYEALKRRERQNLVVGDLPDDVVAAIKEAEYGVAPR